MLSLDLKNPLGFFGDLSYNVFKVYFLVLRLFLHSESAEVEKTVLLSRGVGF